MAALGRPLLRATEWSIAMLFEQCDDRLFQLLCYVGYSIEFPKFLASRIGGHPDWCRHVMYRAIKEEYVSVFRKKTAKRVVTSLRITEKGLNYMAVRSPDVYMMILARIEAVPRGTCYCSPNLSPICSVPLSPNCSSS